MVQAHPVEERSIDNGCPGKTSVFESFGMFPNGLLATHDWVDLDCCVIKTIESELSGSMRIHMHVSFVGFTGNTLNAFNEPDTHLS